MDTSKKYILMCEKAEEIQNEWGVCNGDFFYNKDARITGTALVPFGTDIWNKRYKIWLPRQDQLQEMVGEENPCDLLHSFFTEVYDWEDKRYDYSKDCYEKFTSMEQLWLAFVMKEKYKKVWNGKDWIKKNT